MCIPGPGFGPVAGMRLSGSFRFSSFVMWRIRKGMPGQQGAEDVPGMSFPVFPFWLLLKCMEKVNVFEAAFPRVPDGGSLFEKPFFSLCNLHVTHFFAFFRADVSY